VNHLIHAREIRLIDVDGNQIGIMRPQKALSIAQQQGLDLVEVIPNADVPICRLMDYGRYKDEQSKREKAKKQSDEVLSPPKIEGCTMLMVLAPKSA
jgi:translation initiation factor IF-3